MKTKPFAILLVVLCTFFTAAGSMLFKIASQNFSFSTILFNYFFWIGAIVNGIGAVLLIFAFKHGELSTLFPFVSLTFIWVAFISFFIFSEPMNILKIIAMLSIIIGITSIGRGSK